MIKKPVRCVSHFWLQIKATLHEINEFFVTLDITKGQIVVEHLSVPKLRYI